MSKKLIRLRFCEVALLGTGASIIANILVIIFNGNTSPKKAWIIAAITIAVFLVIYSITLRGFRLDVDGMKSYIMYNFVALAIYCGVAGAFGLVMRLAPSDVKDVLGTVYTWLFYNFKIFRFFTYDGQYHIGTVTSALFHTLFLFAYTAVFGLCVNKTKYIKEEMKRSVQK